jgi:hypothetical protein
MNQQLMKEQKIGNGVDHLKVFLAEFESLVGAQLVGVYYQLLKSTDTLIMR